MRHYVVVMLGARTQQAAREKKRLPGGTGAADCAAGYECCYWVGRISCENPMVLTERNTVCAAANTTAQGKVGVKAVARGLGGL